jgi:hypothetical protein
MKTPKRQLPWGTSGPSGPATIQGKTFTAAVSPSLTAGAGIPGAGINWHTTVTVSTTYGGNLHATYGGCLIEEGIVLAETFLLTRATGIPYALKELREWHRLYVTLQKQRAPKKRAKRARK